ncbi:lycopene cyclase domain-containing protein [Nesterenkonia halotolerans]|uniref:Lycopene cyclase domain-containing protein n=1 Tax=Nesterenkonia halotolerans TaxID=225325 RepID=A0ABR9J6I0_9MICC|nr:lycopene cyclase domain-containing protein [Nesterenkonia halotolerans]MBE1514606.1 lycopene cyclase domain-containing protein [Nesterenkonia halotolerans]
MAYLWLSLAFMVPAVIAAVALRHRIHWAAVGATTLVLLILTAVFDNVIIGLDIVRYGHEHLLGVYLWLAPIEDFSYSLAAVLLLPALWHVLRRRTERASAGQVGR